MMAQQEEQAQSDDEMSDDVPEHVYRVFKGFEQAFHMPGRAVLMKYRPKGTKTDFFVMSIIPTPGAVPVMCAIIPADISVGEMLWQHATLTERHGLPALPAKLN